MGLLVLSDRAWPVDFWIGRTGSPYMTPSGPCWDCRTLNSPGSDLRGSASKADGQSNAITAMPELRSMLGLGGRILTMPPMACQKWIAQTLRDRRWTMSWYRREPRNPTRSRIETFLSGSLGYGLQNLLAGEGPVLKHEALQFAYAIGLMSWYRLQSEKRSHR